MTSCLNFVSSTCFWLLVELWRQQFVFEFADPVSYAVLFRAFAALSRDVRVEYKGMYFRHDMALVVL